jgi:hypothetical protein
MRYVNKNGVRVAYTYYSCDHIRVVTPSTGKQKDQDWFFHCKVFEYLLSHYKREIAHLKHVILWPDGAPNQYKCRQNFYWVANVFERFGISVVHRFGATKFPFEATNYMLFYVSADAHDAEGKADSIFTLNRKDELQFML